MQWHLKMLSLIVFYPRLVLIYYDLTTLIESEGGSPWKENSRA